MAGTVEEHGREIEQGNGHGRWGLNIGLAMMVVTNLFPGGVLQFLDVLNNGYWHARGPEFLEGRIPRLIDGCACRAISFSSAWAPSPCWSRRF